MKKLVWFTLFVMAAITLLSVASLVWPPVGSALYYYGVEIVGVTIVSYISKGFTGFLLWGTSGLAAAVTVVMAIGISFTVFWLVLKHYLWDKPVMNAAKNKLHLGSTVSTQKQMTMQREPAEPEPQPKKEEITTNSEK